MLLGLVFLACSANGQTSFPATPATGAVTFTVPAAFGTDGWGGNWVVTVNGFASKLPTFVHGNTFSSLAADMAGLITSGCNASFCAGQPNNGKNPYVTATATGNVINLTTRATGTTTNYPFSAEFDYFPNGIVLNVVPLPTSGPALTGGQDITTQGYVDPKYVVVGVTYSPPGQSANSWVQYLNSSFVGNTQSVSNSFKDSNTLSVTLTLGFGMPSVEGGKISATYSTTASQTTKNSSTVTTSVQVQNGEKTFGTGNSFAPVNHDYDTVWIWLNPVAIFTIGGGKVVWNGYGFDATDQDGMDIVGIQLGYLNGDFGQMPPQYQASIGRTWAAGQNWPSGQGPALTTTDLAQIASTDPFSISSYGSNYIGGVPPAETPDHRFTMSSCTGSMSFSYNQAGVSQANAPINSCTLTYTNTSTQAQAITTSYSQTFSIDASLTATGWGVSFSADLKDSTTLTWTTEWQNSITTTATSTSSLSVQGPPCNNLVAGTGPCVPVYDSSGNQPVQFDIYQDNMYGTFMFAPIHYYPTSPCDTNSDGSTNVADVQFEINEALGETASRNDTNNDGIVNVADVQIVINADLTGSCEALTPSTLASRSSGLESPTAAVSAPSRRVKDDGMAAAGPNNAVVDIGTLGGSSSSIYGVNNLGLVVGDSETDQSAGPGSSCGNEGCPVRHAFLWEGGRMTDVGLTVDVSSFDSVAYGINDIDQITGSYSQGGLRRASFLYRGGAATRLSDLPPGRARAINNAGQVVGDFSVGFAVSASHAFLWSDGVVTDLGTLGGVAAHASAVNNLGQVVGFSDVTDNSATHAFYYAGSGLTDLGTLGGRNSTALGINDTGQIVGVSQTGGDGLHHAFLYGLGVMTDLGTLGGAESQANGINKRGVIVGWAMTAGGQRHAVVWSSGGIADLNGLGMIGRDAVFEEATAINDFGQIAANGSNGHAYLITLPEELRH